ncbi:MAG: DNRLRE domain-containing protein, partial [Myxococcales bacterium]|nr:DNRLRE domain-containing protein [Myxococcales bacterium]
MLEQNRASTGHGSDKKLSASGDTPGGSGKDDNVLVQWDLGAAIPTTAIVRSASIIVTVTDKADQSYGLFEVVRGWDEATATWNRASSAAMWAIAGAAGATDRAPTQL